MKTLTEVAEGVREVALETLRENKPLLNVMTAWKSDGDTFVVPFPPFDMQMDPFRLLALVLDVSGSDAYVICMDARMGRLGPDDEKPTNIDEARSTLKEDCLIIAGQHGDEKMFTITPYIHWGGDLVLDEMIDMHDKTKNDWSRKDGNAPDLDSLFDLDLPDLPASMRQNLMRNFKKYKG